MDVKLMSEFIIPISNQHDNIYFIEGERKGRYPYSNSLLIEDYLIDTGISSRYLRRLKRQFKINKVLLSHWHEDHVSGNRLLKDVEFSCHSKDKHIIEDIEKMSTYYGLDNTIANDMLDPIIEGFRMENTKISSPFEGGDTIRTPNYEITVIHTPGHTAGHCSFYIKNLKLAFLADIDLAKFIYYGCLDSDLIKYEMSIDKLANLDIEIAISGHKGIFRGSELIKKELGEYKSILKKNDERVLSHLPENEIFNPNDLIRKNIIYKKYSEWKDFEIIGERLMIEKHFEKFLKNGLIEKQDNGYILK
ncbi:MAG: MBL fold metallo-hydrolase [Promethearchaeota archaeon]|nr:MAG: MBL fold metallo-hydrolase [Candidatus Lokiarchaeota archaeon]